VEVVERPGLVPFRPLFVPSLRKDRLTRSEGIPKKAPGQLGVLGALGAGARSTLGEATTTGSRITGGGAALAAFIEALALPEESMGGDPARPRSTTRGDPWCRVPVIARRAGIAGASKKTQVYPRLVSGP
jgi:hypothetical protein